MLHASPDNRALDDGFVPFERIGGASASGLLFICDHAGAGIPASYCGLGLPPEALQRHIAYDIGAAALTRALAQAFRAPAVLASFSRLLIDPNRGHDDPTLVMRYSDGAIVPGNACIEAGEIEHRRRRYWAPYRDAVAGMADDMIAAGEPPAIVSMHSFTPIWRGAARVWKVGVLWDRDPRLPSALLAALGREPDLAAAEIGDNEPYDGALLGDTIDAIATPRGLSNALIEVRQDLIGDAAGVEAWAARLARLIRPQVGKAERRPQDFGSRASEKVLRRSRL